MRLLRSKIIAAYQYNLISTQTALGMLIPSVFVFIWSTGFIVARYGMPYSPPFKFLALRYAISAGIFLVWSLAFRATWPCGRMQWVHLSIAGILMQAVYLGGVWSAVKAGMGAGLTSLLVGLQPVLTALWIAVRGGRVGLIRWCGLALGLAGLLLVVWQKLNVGELSYWNFLCTLVALLAITIGTLYQKHFIATCDVRTASFIQLFAAFAVTLPFCASENESFRWWLDGSRLNIELVGAMGWSVLGLTLGGSSLLYLLIQQGVATSVTSLFYLVPPMTALLAWMLFGEPFTSLTLVGLSLTALGVSLVVSKK